MHEWVLTPPNRTGNARASAPNRKPPHRRTNELPGGLTPSAPPLTPSPPSLYPPFVPQVHLTASRHGGLANSCATQELGSNVPSAARRRRSSFVAWTTPTTTWIGPSVGCTHKTLWNTSVSRWPKQTLLSGFPFVPSTRSQALRAASSITNSFALTGLGMRIATPILLMRMGANAKTGASTSGSGSGGARGRQQAQRSRPRNSQGSRGHSRQPSTATRCTH